MQGGYVSRDNQCYSKECYDSLTDSFCGNLGFATCDNSAQKCNCGNTGLTLMSFHGRCVTENCLIGKEPSRTECWNRGYCQINLAGGICRCYSAYLNDTGCTKCNPETSLEKKVSNGVECIPKRAWIRRILASILYVITSERVLPLSTQSQPCCTYVSAIAMLSV